MPEKTAALDPGTDRWVDDVYREIGLARAPGPKGAGGLVALGKARLTWARARTACRHDVEMIKAVIREVYADQPDVSGEVSRSLGQIDRAVAAVDTALESELDVVLNAPDAEARATAATAAAATAARFRALCQNDPILSSIDGSEFAPEIRSVASMLDCLARLETVLAAMQR